ncbi:MAG: hypothetical protein AAF732_09730 [Pseudomonadota bacterium]
MLAVSAQHTFSVWQDVLADLGLARIAVRSGATNGEIIRDLGPFAAHRLSPSEFRTEMTAALGDLAYRRLFTETRGRLRVTALGEEAAHTLLGWRGMPAAWPEVRDAHVTALALGMADAAQTRIRLLARPDGLRAAVLQAHFGFKLRRVPTLARVRSALAGIALKQAFGNTLPDGMQLHDRVNARSSRLLAAHLSRTPRDFGSDGRLIAALAAEVLGTPQSDVGSVRLAVFRRYVAQRLLAEDERADADVQLPRGPGQSTLVHARPDLEGFKDAVLEAAEASATGWAGSRKALICDVWDEVRTRFPDWRLSEVEFKGMLTQAHRTGHLSLAHADLKSKEQTAALQRSAVNYNNTVWHFVRLASETGTHQAQTYTASGNTKT